MYRIVLAGILFITTLTIALHWQPVNASHSAPLNMPGAGVDLAGWLWSSTVGWISLNCENTGTCGVSTYGVTIEPTGELIGWGWASTIGWIQFGQPAGQPALSGFPTGAGTDSFSAHVTGDYTGVMTLHGWARACAGTADGVCGTMTDYAGGWDGWIAFSGTATDGSPYLTTLNSSGGAPGSFAWGGSVVGWTDTTGITVGPGGGTTPTVNVFTATPLEVSTGDPVDLYFDVQNVTECTGSNTNSNGNPDTGWNFTDPIAGAETRTTTVYPNAGDTTYDIECTDGVSVPVNDDEIVRAADNLRITNFSVSSGPTFNAGTGLYDVTFSATVAGKYSTGPVNYAVRIDGTDYPTGTITFNAANAAAGQRTQNITITGLPAAGSVNARLFVDPELPFNGGDSMSAIFPVNGGAIQENLSSTLPNEDQQGNRSNPATIIVGTMPTVSINGPFPDIARADVPFDVEIEVGGDPVPHNCDIAGPGTVTPSATFTVTPPAGGTDTELLTIDGVTNAATYRVRCSNGPLGGPLTTTTTFDVEVIPTVEEF